MKRRILSIVACVALFTTTAVGQETGFGAKLGLNLASQSGDVSDLGDIGMRTSLHLGGYYLYMVSDNFAIQPELVFSGQGFTQSVEIDLGPFGGVQKYDATYKMNYINLPILAKYYVTEGLDIHAGLQFGFNISAKAEVDGNTEDMEDVSGFDMAIPFGLGYQLESGLNFAARYNLGLSNTYSGDGDFTAKNNVIQISVGYGF